MNVAFLNLRVRSSVTLVTAIRMPETRGRDLRLEADA